MNSAKSSTYHVHHILVQHQYEADDILRALKSGKKFEDLAKVRSTCPSAKNGGDLGQVRWGKADPNFEEAVEMLKVNTITEKPIRTKFGYHVIWRRA